MVDKPAYRCYACFSFTAIVKKDMRWSPTTATRLLGCHKLFRANPTSPKLFTGCFLITTERFDSG